MRPTDLAVHQELLRLTLELASSADAELPSAAHRRLCEAIDQHYLHVLHRHHQDDRAIQALRTAYATVCQRGPLACVLDDLRHHIVHCTQGDGATWTS